VTDWVLSPLILCALSGVGLLASLGLWIAAKLEIGAVRNEVSDSRGAMTIRVQEVVASLHQLLQDRETEIVPPVGGFGEGVNLTKRSQILRMRRRGETETSIAAAVQVPRNEVELVLKLDQLLNSVQESGSPEAAH